MVDERCQTRHPRLPRSAALRVAPRQEQCARHDGSAAGREYAAVLLVLSRLPKHARPVPPIYRPEFGARGILYAADHPHRREYWVGASTMATLPAKRDRRWAVGS